MTLIGETPIGGAGAGAPTPADLIKDATDASFVADVIEASKTTPVIVDFWAPWCGPCRQLGPAIEKAVVAAKGAVKLVKIDIDQNPAYAGQLRVQSIPAVFAFVDGRPVDGFMGALPDSQVKQFVDRLAKQGGGSPIDELIAMAKESLELKDLGGAQAAPHHLRGRGAGVGRRQAGPPQALVHPVQLVQRKGPRWRPTAASATCRS
jgi:putative thioredoxin